VTGVELAFDDAGGDDPVAVVLPMFTTSRQTTTAAFGLALTGASVRTVYLNPPGHGDSPATVDVSSQAVLDEVCGWLAAHTTGPVLLAGASYGGYLAAAVARQHPDLVRGLLLVCPGVRPGHRTLPTGAPPPAPADWLDDVPTDLHEHLDQAIGHRTRTVAARVSTALAAGPDGDTAFQEALRASPGYALADETSDTTFDGPVTVLAGRQDRIAGYADQFAVMSRYPRGTYAVLDDAGHYLPFEQRFLFRALTQQWLSHCLR